MTAFKNMENKMRAWRLEGAASDAALIQDAVAKIVTGIGVEGFSRQVLQQVNRVIPVGCWSVYRVGGTQPCMFLSSTYQRKDTTADSWRAYLSGPHLADKSFILDSGQASSPAITHLTAEEIPTPIHREKVYRQFDMSERLSVVEAESDNEIFALNFYRYNDQHLYSDHELATFEALAPALLAAVRRHLALSQRSQLTNTMSVDSVRLTFQTHRRDLTERELDVLARAVLGMSYEGIANDLDLKLPTVKTYRNRAFDRLGIHFRNELIRYY
ncbi:MAG TPA: helix-turn-helix transcriptional regulator, partial [Pusillimonas sp.]|nr:helix-turn-helix transcriptional regulator [Pusillimonas sp.]